MFHALYGAAAQIAQRSVKRTFSRFGMALDRCDMSLDLGLADHPYERNVTPASSLWLESSGWHNGLGQVAVPASFELGN